MLKIAAAAVATLLFAAPNAAHASTENPLLGLNLVDLRGKPVPVKNLKDKVVLVVNVASRCGFTGQYKGLQKLYQKYQKSGLMVLGVPCNQFGWQEPGNADEIQSFCSSKYQVTFPILKKQKVRGDEKTPLYRYLVNSKIGDESEVRWNFEKFLVDRKGQVVARFRSSTEPSDKEVLAAIEKALGTKVKKN